MQIRTRYVQRNVGRVDHTLHQHHEFRNYAFNRVGHKHLIAIELDAVARDVYVVLDFREVEYSCQSEGVVYIQVNPEQRIILTGIELAIEVAVVVVGKVGRLFSPCGFGVVYYFVAVGVDIFSVLPLLFFS